MDEEKTPIEGETSIPKPKNRTAEEALAKKRIFFLIVFLCVAVMALIVWEIADLFL